MKPLSKIAIFGGAFDPIHLGHTGIAKAAQEQCHFDHFVFLPCKIPLLKENCQASPEQRVEMIQLAIAEHPEFSIDLREINRSSPSYMVETLKSFRNDHPEASLNLLLGQDAYERLPEWHQWQSILDFAHLVVMTRSKYEKKTPLRPLPELESHIVTDKGLLSTRSHGCIYFISAGLFEISSSMIRHAIENKKSLAKLLDKKVIDYIKIKQLYKPT